MLPEEMLSKQINALSKRKKKMRAECVEKNYKSCKVCLEYKKCPDADPLYKKNKKTKEVGIHGLAVFFFGNNMKKGTRSESKKGKNNPMYGKLGKNHPRYKKKHTKATRNKMSKAKKGKNNNMYGVHKFGKDSPNYKGGLIEKICETCGNEFFVAPSVLKRNINNGKFCSRSCYAKSRIGENNPNWKNGIAYEPYAPSFNRQLKDRIRVRDNFICQLCGVPELECDTKLAVHHIDYDKKNCREDNLISLCHICHSKTNGNRKYWTNYFINNNKKGITCV